MTNENYKFYVFSVILWKDFCYHLPLLAGSYNGLVANKKNATIMVKITLHQDQNMKTSHI